MSLRYELGKAGQRRGAWNERRTLYAALDLREEWPEWLFGLRAGTAAEDARGWDLVAVTDIGKIGIQVKSSRGALRRHFRRRPKVPGLYVNGLTDRQAGERLLLVVGRARVVLLRKRG